MTSIPVGLAPAVKGARKRGQTITWVDEDGAVVDLTSATITAVRILVSDATRAEVAITGTLAVVSGPAGTFTWAYSALDVLVDAYYQVRFLATYPDTLVTKNFWADWRVHP